MNQIELESEFFEIEENRLKLYSGCTDALCIPSGIDTIMEGAFKGNSTLKRVSIPESVQYIDAKAFMDCVSLEEVIFLGNHLEYISYQAFCDCSKLKRISLPEGIIAIPTQCFKGCEALEEINVPITIQLIEAQAFVGCTALRSFTFPQNIRTIELEAFRKCNSISEIILPDNIEFLGFRAFYGCNKLSTVTIPGSLKDFVDKNNEGLQYFEKKNGNNAFEDCVGLRKAIIKEGVMTIPEDFFSGSSIEEIRLPHSLVKIMPQAFMKCKYLYEIDIPDRVEFIGRSAFFECNSLFKVKLPSNENTEIAHSAFAHCGIKSLSIPASYKKIGESIFYGCGLLENLMFHEGLECIEDFAFLDCSSLREIRIPHSVREISPTAFDRCRIENVIIDKEPLLEGNPFNLLPVKKYDAPLKWKIANRIWFNKK